MNIKIGMKVRLKSCDEIMALGLLGVSCTSHGGIFFDHLFLVGTRLSKEYTVDTGVDANGNLVVTDGHLHLIVRPEFLELLTPKATISRVYYIGETAKGEVIKGSEKLVVGYLTLIKGFNQSVWTEVVSARVKKHMEEL